MHVIKASRDETGWYHDIDKAMRTGSLAHIQEAIDDLFPPGNPFGKLVVTQMAGRPPGVTIKWALPVVR